MKLILRFTDMLSHLYMSQSSFVAINDKSFLGGKTEKIAP